MNRYYDYPYSDQWGDAEYLSGNDCFDLEKFKHSETGRDLAAARYMMKEYSGVDDPALLERWEKIGVRCEVRETAGKRWLAFMPKAAYDADCAVKYPVMLIFRPVGLLAEAFYEYMIQQVAQDDFIALIYCAEDPNENDVFVDMLKEIQAQFPTDPSRVYVTGHSHYGELCMEFMRRHHEMIAAVAQQGDAPGLLHNFYGLTDEKLEMMHTWDMPLSIVTGTTEMVGCFPMNTDAPGIPEDSRYRKSSFPMKAADRMDVWQRRLYGMNCPVCTTEEMLDAANGNIVNQQLGCPADRTDVFYAAGSECYLADFKNNNGKYHFRVVAIENLPHTTSTLMHIVSWSFLRRFARDLETGAVIERY